MAIEKRKYFFLFMLEDNFIKVQEKNSRVDKL